MKASYLNNKWMRAAVPALLIHACIGSVYCWSLLKGDIATEVGCSVKEIEFAFSLAIFFLGMSAAFGGRFVEKNVTAASVVSCLCFSTGLLLTVFSIYSKSVLGIMLSYGCLMGVGLGIGYLSPVKTLMLWFKEHKGLATGIAISGFGLSKVIFSPYIEWCTARYDISTTLVSMSVISIFSMLTAAWLIKKPADWVEPKVRWKLKDYWQVLKNGTFLKIWFVFYINITCGLALIAFEKNIAVTVGIAAVMIGLLSSLTAFFNTAGRFGYSTVSDYTENKQTIYKILLASSVLAMLLGFAFSTFQLFNLSTFVIVLMLCVINAGYGGGFSTLPTLLQSKFGMEKISTIHGLALSAWAWAGLSGNQLSNLIINQWEKPYEYLYVVLAALYLIALLLTFSIPKNKEAIDYEEAQQEFSKIDPSFIE
ncbi:MAG: OFA family MFS transporter [Bacteroidaceae bacterium]|nr:OFA family MFS transporter [Bacteroidaceae bacterium]